MEGEIIMGQDTRQDQQPSTHTLPHPYPYRPAQPSKVEHWMDYKEIEGWALIRGGLARDQEGSQPWARNNSGEGGH